MASSLAVDGLVSGLDTTALINSLMQVEAVPQTLLKGKVSASQSYITALQSLNAKVATLTDLAKAATKPLALNPNSATTSSTKATATATNAAGAGQLDFTVQQLAQGQKSVTSSMASWPDPSFTLTVVGADGVSHEITADSESLDDMVIAVNAADAGITATKVAVGGGNYRLQFSSNEIGAASAFTVHQGSGTGTPLVTTEIQKATDASITIWAGSPAAQTITSTSNTFSDLLPGVSISVSGISADPITVTVSRDDTAIGKQAGDLIAGLNAIFAEIATKSAVSTTTDASGSSSTKAGVLAGDSVIRDAKQKLIEAATLPVNGRSPSEFGISITKLGTIEFEADKFAAALAKDPAATQAALLEISTRVAAAGKTVSDKYDGTLTSKITGQESEVKQLGLQIEDWSRRLTSRRSTLERTYSALEVQLSRLNSQQNYMSSQLASLNSSSS